MTGSRVEEVVRRTLRDKATQLDDSASLLAGVRATARRQRQRGAAGMLAAAAAGAALVVGLVPLGTGDQTTSAEPGRWERLGLGPVQPNVGFRFVEGSDPPVLIAAGLDTFRAWVIRDRAEPATVGPQPTGYVELVVAAGGPGLVAIGEVWDQGKARRVSWLSPDGSAWETIDPAGELAETDTVYDVAATADGFVAVGQSGPIPSPRVWRSTNGRAWEAAPTPSDGDGALTAVASDGEGRVVAAGPGGVWTSVDGGDTWIRCDVAAAEQVSLTHGPKGFLIVGIDDAGAPIVASSADGVDWSSPTPPEALVDRLDRLATVAAIPTGFVVVTTTVRNTLPDMARCYADPGYCAQVGPMASVLEDGRWALLDLTGLGGDEQLVHDLAVFGDDLVVLMGGQTLWRHDLQTLARPDPQQAPTPPAGPPLVESGARLEVGKIYRYPLYAHCGAEFLGRFNAANWLGVAGTVLPEHELPGYMSAGQTILGELTVVAEDRLEYRAGGVLVGVYQPSSDEPPGFV